MRKVKAEIILRLFPTPEEDKGTDEEKAAKKADREAKELRARRALKGKRMVRRAHKGAPPIVDIELEEDKGKPPPKKPPPKPPPKGNGNGGPPKGSSSKPKAGNR